MRICIVTHKVRKGDGQGRVNYEVAMEALKRGYHLTLVTSEIDPQLQQHRQVEWVPIEVSHYPSELLRNLMFAAQAKRWVDRHRPAFDLIKTNGAIADISADVNAAHFIHSTWLRSAAHIARSHGNVYGLYQWFYTRMNAHWEKQAFQRARVVVAVSEGAAAELQAIGIPAEKIRVIYNGVDPEEFKPAIADRQRFNLPQGVPLALFVGDIKGPRKNLDTVLKALTFVPTLHLAVAGCLQGSPYPTMAEQMGLQDQVHFLDYCSDLPRLMQAVDCFVFPSHYETCGLVVLEAMASGLPVITAKTVGAYGLITPESGFVLPGPNDVTALARALELLAQSPELRSTMGAAARAIAQDHSWQSMAREYVDLLTQKVRSHPQAALPSFSHTHVSPTAK